MTVRPIEIEKPYLLFLGAAESNLGAKTAAGIAHWRHADCAGQLRLPGAGADIGLPDMTLAEARAAGARTLVLGVAPVGGRLPEAWVALCVEALEAGLGVAAGLHQRLADIPAIAEASARSGRPVADVRVPPEGLPCGTGRPRAGRRLLTVGTDCAVGKMFTALALERELHARAHPATFRATGQTGIFIAGSGMPIDAVVSDFLSGSVEVLCPEAQPSHWDVIEGQGSLFHPAYAAVSLGLLHGAQPDALVLCHEAGRTHIEGGDYDAFALPDFATAMARNVEAARLTNPEARMAGLAINTAGLAPSEAERHLADLSERHGLPAVDPVRTGVGPIVDLLESGA
jgi:uncharacterized NAD-dependent epimerase/dehydratase family protein